MTRQSLKAEGGAVKQFATEFTEAVEAGEVFSGHDYLQWSRVGDFLGHDGRLVYGGELAPWVTDWWVTQGRVQIGDEVGIAREEARVLTETPCTQAAQMALDLRRLWEGVGEGRTTLDAGFGVSDTEHYLFPMWSPGLEEWLENPVDTPPPASPLQDRPLAQSWEAKRLTLCHVAAAVLGPLAALADWEAQMVNGGTPSEAGAGVSAYQRMMRKSESGYTDAGLRLLSLWLASKSGWRHVYAEPIEVTADDPLGVSPCDLADQLKTWSTEMDGRTAVFHPCPPKAPDPGICHDTQHLQAAPVPHTDGTSVNTHHHEGPHEAPPPPASAAAFIEMPACRFHLIADACTEALSIAAPDEIDEVIAWCEAEIDKLLAEIEALRQAIKEEEQRLLDELDKRNDAPPLLGGLLYQANLPRYQALLVIGAALEELGNDAVLFDDAANAQVARSLYALECPPESDNSGRSYCTAGVPDTVENLLARKGGGFLEAWHLGEPEGVWASKSWDAGSGIWTVTTASGDTVRRTPVECPWLVRWHRGDSLGRCTLASAESVSLLAVFGYSPHGGGFVGGSCPEVSWDSRGVVLAGDGSSAAIKDETDPRLGVIQSGGQEHYVHVCLVKPLSELLAWSGRVMDPPLTVWSAWRSTTQQANLRRAHCGGEANIHNPDAVCHPLTARPGFSMHNAGLAVDFSNCSTRGTPCFNWLSHNMPAGFLVNLPAEPWHWSINGQ